MKALDRVKHAAAVNCERLGKYRMPFAWTAINLIDIMQGSSSASGASGNGSSLAPETKGNRDSMCEQRASTPEPPRLRSGSEPGDCSVLDLVQTIQYCTGPMQLSMH